MKRKSEEYAQVFSFSLLSLPEYSKEELNPEPFKFCYDESI